MKQFLFAIYDVKADAFNAPIAVISKAAAIRSFTDAVNDTKTDFYKHAEDYSLFIIAEWEPLSGNINPFKAPERVITALECRPDVSIAQAAA